MVLASTATKFLISRSGMSLIARPTICCTGRGWVAKTVINDVGGGISINYGFSMSGIGICLFPLIKANQMMHRFQSLIATSDGRG